MPAPIVYSSRCTDECDHARGIHRPHTLAGHLRHTCSCGEAWADEPGHDDDQRESEPDGNDQPLTPDEIVHEARYGTEII